MLVKIIVTSSQALNILKFDQTVLHKRKLSVFKVEKCRLGESCTRRICRFGHEERHKDDSSGSISPSLIRETPSENNT